MLGGSTSLPMAQEESHGPRPRVHISLPQALSLTDISSGITLVPGSITQLKLHDSPGRQQSVQGSFPTSVKTLPKTHSRPRYEDAPEHATPTLFTAGLHNPRDSRSRLCCQIFPTF